MDQDNRHSDRTTHNYELRNYPWPSPTHKCFKLNQNVLYLPRPILMYWCFE